MGFVIEDCDLSRQNNREYFGFWFFRFIRDRLKQIIKHINTNNSITINELSNFCEVGRETIKRDIKKLRELKIIERIGSDKTGYWKIL